jgi:hypothetical protein
MLMPKKQNIENPIEEEEKVILKVGMLLLLEILVFKH